MVIFSEVSKIYGKKQAVKNLSFKLKQSQITALLGPNGAGKSTSIKMLTGYLPVTSGNIRLCNYQLPQQTRQAQTQIGYLPEGTPLYSEATVYEFLSFIASARAIPVKAHKLAISKVLSLCGLEQVKHQLIDTLSKGYRQRTCFAQSIIHDPQVLVLDEPTDGLDPNQKRDIQELIKEMGQSKTILISTHIMAEAEFMADRIILLSEGQCKADGNLSDLRKQLGAVEKVILAISPDINSERVISSISSLTGLQKIERINQNYDEIVFHLTPDTQNDDNFINIISAHCIQNNWKIRRLLPVTSSLSKLFQQATKQKVIS